MVLRSETWNKLGSPISPRRRSHPRGGVPTSLRMFFERVRDSTEFAPPKLLLHLDDERGFDAVKFRRRRVEQIFGALRVSRAR